MDQNIVLMLDLVPNIHQHSQIILFYDILSDAIQPKTEKIITIALKLSCSTLLQQ